MNKNYLPGETIKERCDRLRAEMNAEVVAHKKAIVVALEAAGHKVKANEKTFEQDRFMTYWDVNGEFIEVQSRMEHGSGLYGSVTGGLRIIVGPHNNNQKTFVKPAFAKKRAKYPSGFDYVLIAKTMADIVEAKKRADAENAAERERADENDEVARPAARRLMKEFGIKSFYDDFIPEPLVVDRGHKELELKFRGLSEEQARRILAAAQACGALDENEEE